ncbi:hypothetical protein [Candidatus Hodarchaeum mangrovi]
MAEKSNSLFKKWINGRFDSKVVVSVTQKGQYKNFDLSLINGRQYNTKFGSAMSAQVGPKDLNDLIQALQEVQNKFFQSGPQESE